MSRRRRNARRDGATSDRGGAAPPGRDDISRRAFLRRSGSCAAHLALASSVMPELARAQWIRTAPERMVLAREPFGRLERIADDIWALISTPLGGDATTLANGGIVAGRHAVLAIEGFNTSRGAAWLAARAREVTGRWPTHIALTHFHSDHANGVAGYLSGAEHPVLRSTARTRDLVVERNRPADASRAAALRDAVVLPTGAPTVIDLGGRTVRLTPRAGHTESDVSLELDDPHIVFCGDLFWNAMFPNFVDALPVTLSASVRALRRTEAATYIPGHGPVGTPADYDRYVAMLDEVERAARRAFAAGTQAADAAAAFMLPASLGEWTLFGRSFYPRAFSAWYRDLR